MKTSDPRVRVVNHGHENWRTEYREEAGGRVGGYDWHITGPPYPTKTEALLHVDEVAHYCYDVIRDDDGNPLRTRSGRELTESQIAELVAEAEEGYVPVWDVDAGKMIMVNKAEAAAGMARYARRLGPGTPACGVWERAAADLARE